MSATDVNSADNIAGVQEYLTNILNERISWIRFISQDGGKIFSGSTCIVYYSTVTSSWCVNHYTDPRFKNKITDWMEDEVVLRVLEALKSWNYYDPRT